MANSIIMAKEREAFFSGTSHNIMGSGTRITGDIVASEDFRIDGEVEGTIECKGKIVMGSGARVNGTIRCQEADLMGTFTGNIEVEGILTLRSTLILNGDVITQKLEIEPGAIFNGTCKMMSNNGAKHHQYIEE